MAPSIPYPKTVGPNPFNNADGPPSSLSRHICMVAPINPFPSYFYVMNDRKERKWGCVEGRKIGECELKRKKERRRWKVKKYMTKINRKEHVLF